MRSPARINRHALIMSKTLQLALQLFVITVLTACATGPRIPAGQACVTAAMTVSDNFHGARRGTCMIISAQHVRLDILPEDNPPIINSPWFAFRLEPTQPSPTTITLRYMGGYHRYWPKYSYDGLEWWPFADQNVMTATNGRKAVLTIALDDRSVYIAAQELITPSVYDTWYGSVARRGNAARSLLGRSRNGQPIYRLDVNENARDVLLITGRQHPPEVSGAFAFLAFADTLLADTDIAREFRQRFRIVAIPLLNPDGVNGGNWRHNLGGVDLNRDWGPFTQPETQAIRDLLAELDAGGHRIRMFLDFHSTTRNVFYTQNADFVTDPPDFMNRWLERAAVRIENYEFANERNPVSEQANSKNYMYKRYGIPTATYEVGDETDRRATQDAAIVFADELMRLMLSQSY